MSIKNSINHLKKGSRLTNPVPLKWIQALSGLGVGIVAPLLVILESATGITMTEEQAVTLIGMLANPQVSIFGWLMFIATIVTTNKIGLGTKK